MSKPPPRPRRVAWSLALIAAAATAGPPADGAAAPERRRQLEQQVRHDSRDARAWALIAYDDMAAGHHAEAASAFRKAIDASPKVAGDAGVLCDYAEALALAQGGEMRGAPTEWVMKALALKGSHPKALEMAGSAAYARRDFAGATRYWRDLRAQMTQTSPQRDALDAAIARAQRLAATSLR